MAMFVHYTVRDLCNDGPEKSVLRKHIARMHASLYKTDFRFIGEHCAVNPNNCDNVTKFRQYLNDLIMTGRDSAVSYWVAWYGHEPIAFAKVVDYGTATVPRNFDIELMFVKPKYRGKGIGTELIRSIKAGANTECKKPFVLSVGVARRNLLATDFYKKNHFLPVSLRMQMFCDKTD